MAESQASRAHPKKAKEPTDNLKRKSLSRSLQQGARPAPTPLPHPYRASSTPSSYGWLAEISYQNDGWLNVAGPGCS